MNRIGFFKLLLLGSAGTLLINNMVIAANPAVLKLRICLKPVCHCNSTANLITGTINMQLKYTPAKQNLDAPAKPKSHYCKTYGSGN